MDTIVGQPTIGDLEDALENLPKGLDELNKTYDQAMQRIDGQPGKHRELAYKILIWVIHTKRALSTWEIRDALAIKPGQPSLNYKYRPELETINSLCAGLITVDANSEIVRLVHYTTKEYFTKKQVFPNADAMLAEACITCIAFDAFQDGSVQGLVPHRDSVIQPRIYEYAAHFWGYHAKAISYRDNLVFSFLNHTGKASACAQLVLCQGEGGQLFSQLNILGIHLTALLGLQYLMDVLIENGQSPSAVNKYGHTPLWFAAWNGKCDIVQYLITQCGIKSHEELQKPFLLAIDRGHYDIVDFILPFIDPQTLTYSGEKRARIKALPLSEAAQKGHLRIVELLLKDGRVELNYQDRDGYTALHDAIVGEQEPVAMRLLTTRGVDPGLQNNHGATPFLLAARHGLLVVVEHLLKQKYVDYNVIDSMGRSAFLQAVEGGHSEIVDLLLGKTKVQPDIEDLEEETAISHPIRIGYLKIEPDIMDFNQRTAISYAAQGGHLRVLNTLLEYDIPGDTKDKDGRTPFWYAASEGHLEAMKFLLSKYIVSPNTEDKNGQTPFSIAAKNGHTQVLVFLYSNCNVDVDSRDQEGYTPLTHAISGRHMQNGDYLLSIGADLQTRDKVGRTLLDHSNDEKIIELLLRKGAGPDDYAHEVAVRYFGLHSEIAKLVKARVTS
jgi:ankyrin repeat protein